MDSSRFKLSQAFIDKYKRKKAPFGFNGLGELVFMRTYSRLKENGKKRKMVGNSTKGRRRNILNAKRPY